MSDIANHRRVNDILLGPLERPALKWLAAHMPAWVSPDTCTIVGILGAFLTMLSYILSNYERDFLWLAFLGFFINWLGDSLDGTLARTRHIERPIFGFFIDHTVDGFVAVLIFLGLGLSPQVSFSAACLALIGYLLLSVLVYVQTSAVGEFKISFGRLGPTEIRAVAILLNTAMYFGKAGSYSLSLVPMGVISFSIYDVLVSGLALLLFGFAITRALKQTIRLKNIDGEKVRAPSNQPVGRTESGE